MASLMDKLYAMVSFKPKEETKQEHAQKADQADTFHVLSTQFLDCEDAQQKAEIWMKMCKAMPGTLFLAAMCFEGDDPHAPVRDKELHATVGAKSLYAANESMVTKGNPGYRLAKKADDRRIHLRTLVSQKTKEVWIPLFTDFTSLLPVFGRDSRITIISFAEARQMARSYKGIMINPGKDVIRLDNAELKKI